MKSFVHVACVVAMLAGSAAAQDAVQWRVEDGGNGHWYQFDQTILHWSPHQDRAMLRGGYLATVTSNAEREHINAILYAQEADIWLGGNTNWPLPITWVTAEAFVYEPTYWCPPNGYNPGGGYAIEICGRDSCPGQFCWNIEAEDCLCWPGNKAVYEWSADCNSDGIVDFGQIRSGELDDANLNNIPDCCEAGVSCTPCEGDVSGNGVVDGVDLAAVLGAWGSSGKGEFSTDTNGDGFVDGADLATVLSGWGPCPN